VRREGEEDLSVAADTAPTGEEQVREGGFMATVSGNKIRQSKRASPGRAARRGGASHRFALLGVPWDEKSSFRRGAALAPAEIRKALMQGTEHGALDRWSIVDKGDVILRPSDEKFFVAIEARVRQVLAEGFIPAVLGGDHSVTYGSVRAFRRLFNALDLVWMDAHPDLFLEFKGERFSHACTALRILEQGFIGSCYQIGIRESTTEQERTAAERGVHTFTVDQVEKAIGLSVRNPAYLSIDIDVLDPAEAPGVSDHIPGGLPLDQLLMIIRSLRASIVGFDLVEINPRMDPSRRTIEVALQILREMMAATAANREPEMTHGQILQ